MITILTKNNKKYLNGEEIQIHSMYDGENFSGCTWCNKAGEVVLDERTEYDPLSAEEVERLTKELADLMHDDYI